LTTENGLQMPRFYPYLVEIKPEKLIENGIFEGVLSLLSGIKTEKTLGGKT